MQRQQQQAEAQAKAQAQVAAVAQAQTAHAAAAQAQVSKFWQSLERKLQQRKQITHIAHIAPYATLYYNNTHKLPTLFNIKNLELKNIYNSTIDRECSEEEARVRLEMEVGMSWRAEETEKIVEILDRKKKLDDEDWRTIIEIVRKLLEDIDLQVPSPLLIPPQYYPHYATLSITRLHSISIPSI